MRLIDADTMIDRLDTDEYGMRLPKAVAGLTKVLIDDAPTIVTKLIKYFDEDENVWKVGEVIVDEQQERIHIAERQESGI